MPEGYKKPKWRLRPEFGLADAGKQGYLLKVHCRFCKRTRYFHPADIVRFYGDHEVDNITFTCPTCNTNRMVQIDLYNPAPGDYGVLDVRRPISMNVVKWRTVKLGDDPL